MSAKRVLLRIGLSLALGMVLSLLISEAAYMLQPDRLDRGPQRVELVIPSGTAEQVAAGQASPDLPAEMAFVQGDVLVVKNEDVTSHQLGPVWVPAGSQGSLKMELADKFSYDCSFQPNKYVGINVQPAVTLETRVWAMAIMGLPAGGLIAVYSLAMVGSKKDDQAALETGE